MAGPNNRYTAVAIILHWVMALCIAGLAAMGLAMTHLALSPLLLFKLYQLHKSIGITMLAAALLRLVWRLAHRPPQLPSSLPGRERLAAHGNHLVLYLLLFALPVSGWALVSSSTMNIPTVLFGMVTWPDLPFFSSLSEKAPVEAILSNVHAYGALTLLGLVTVHVAAALRHHFVLGDDILTRMLPGFTRRNPRQRL